MPNVTVPGVITSENVESVLQRELGGRLIVERPQDEAPNRLVARFSELTYANVRLDPHDSDTTFHVHGGGFLIGRAINEFGIAREVATVLKNVLSY